MNAAKRIGWTTAIIGSLRRFKPSLPRGSWRIVLFLILVVSLIVGARMAWQQWSAEIAADSRYQLKLDSIQITPQPDWIAGDIKSQVFHERDLGSLSILDSGLTEKIANAFIANAWVAGVRKVTKHAGPRVDVELEYRKPVAMVEVWAGDKPGLVPIDAAGVLLPTGGFADQTHRYLRIAVADLHAYREVGAPWADQRVLDAAKIATAWENDWRNLQLYRIVAVAEPSGSHRWTGERFELQTKSGTRIVWGRPPGREQPGEARAAEKVSALIEFETENGSLDEEITTLDVRSGRVVPAVSARTPTDSQDGTDRR